MRRLHLKPGDDCASGTDSRWKVGWKHSGALPSWFKTRQIPNQVVSFGVGVGAETRIVHETDREAKSISVGNPTRRLFPSDILIQITIDSLSQSEFGMRPPFNQESLFLMAIFLPSCSTVALTQEDQAEKTVPQVQSKISLELSEVWPPSWLEGMWRVESVKAEKDGQPSTVHFLTSDYYVFSKGFRFTVYEDRKISAIQLMGLDSRGAVNYCLMKRRDNLTPLRARIERTEVEGKLKLTNSVLIRSTPGRFHLTYHLVRVDDLVEGSKIVESALEKAYQTSGGGREVLEDWLTKVKQETDHR